MQHMGHNDDSIYKLASICYDFIFVKFHDNKTLANLAFTDTVYG